MQVENRVYPTPEQITGLRQPAPGAPIVMVNLLKYRAKAQYPDGSEPELSGREAYQRYAVAVEKLVEGVGGRVLYAGAVTSLFLGQVEGLWDEIALAEYPSRAALLQMVRSPEAQAIAYHRAAGLEGQLNIETVPSLVALRAGKEA
ncbi:MAG: DUF1330 domain-containing protein [Candidatus Binatia bacterium]